MVGYSAAGTQVAGTLVPVDSSAAAEDHTAVGILATAQEPDTLQGVLGPLGKAEDNLRVGAKAHLGAECKSACRPMEAHLYSYLDSRY